MPGPPDLVAFSFVNQSYRADMAANRSSGGGFGAPFVCAPFAHAGMPSCDKLAHQHGRANRIVRDAGACLSCRDWARHACVPAWRSFLTSDAGNGGTMKKRCPGGNDSRSGKLCNCVARHTVTLSGFGAIFPPRGAGACLFSNPDEEHAKAPFRVSGVATVAASLDTRRPSAPHRGEVSRPIVWGGHDLARDLQK